MRISDWSSDVCSSDLAEALAAEGHQVVFFLRNLWDCRAQLTRSPLPFIQSPDLVPPNPAERGPKSMGAYSDIMVYCGFGKLESLFTATLAWRTLLDELRPDLIVCAHSPAVCFAAYGRVPVGRLGAGLHPPPACGDALPGHPPNNEETM